MKILANLVSDTSLIGRLVSVRFYSKQLLQPIIRVGWRFVKDFKIEEVSPNRFLFTFISKEDKDRVLQMAPWNFKGLLMILKEWASGINIDETPLDHAEYWVQIHGLPLGSLERDNALLPGSKIGELLSVDAIDIQKPYLRIKIRFHIDSPLSPGFYIPRRHRGSLWVQFKYEHLSNFCLHCGKLDHTISLCQTAFPHPYQAELSANMRGTPPASLAYVFTPHSPAAGRGRGALGLDPGQRSGANARPSGLLNVDLSIGKGKPRMQESLGSIRVE